MKRADLEQRIAKLAADHGATWEYVGGGDHDKFRLNGKNIMIPRHREIGEGLARTILKQARRALGLE